MGQLRPRFPQLLKRPVKLLRSLPMPLPLLLPRLSLMLLPLPANRLELSRLTNTLNPTLRPSTRASLILPRRTLPLPKPPTLSLPLRPRWPRKKRSAPREEEPAPKESSTLPPRPTTKLFCPEEVQGCCHGCPRRFRFFCQGRSQQRLRPLNVRLIARPFRVRVTSSVTR